MPAKAAEKPKKKGRPAKPHRQKHRPISASLPPELHDALARYERANGVSRSAAVAEAIRRLVG